MKLNASDFRKNFEEKLQQKKQADESFLRIQLAMQASIDKRKEYFTELCAMALNAALNSQQELDLGEDDCSEYVDYLQKFGFDIDEREITSDSLLEKVRNTNPKELKSLEHQLSTALTKIVMIAEPEIGSDLFNAYKEYINADDQLDIKTKHLLKVVNLYNKAYHEDFDLSLDVDAKLWLYLSRLQDIIIFYDPENDTEECFHYFLRWEDKYIDIQESPAPDSPFSMLNPIKLRFINSQEGEVFFSKIAEDMTAQTEALQSVIQFDFIFDGEDAHVLFPDGIKHMVPFNAQDLQLIFEKMQFKATFKSKILRRENQVFAFKVKF